MQSLWCNGSHGISVGSLGQYVGEFDIVQDVFVTNISMFNASDGARIKVWPNTQSALSGDLQGGGGEGMVKNITYDGFYISNVDYSIEITQCYGRKSFTLASHTSIHLLILPSEKNTTLCLEYPSPLTITDIVIKNFYGTTSTEYSPQIAAFLCSSESVCSNISVTNINVTSPAGTNEAYCLNMDETTLDVTCTDTLLGTN